MADPTATPRLLGRLQAPPFPSIGETCNTATPGRNSSPFLNGILWQAGGPCPDGLRAQKGTVFFPRRFPRPRIYLLRARTGKGRRISEGDPGQPIKALERGERERDRVLLGRLPQARRLLSRRGSLSEGDSLFPEMPSEASLLPPASTHGKGTARERDGGFPKAIQVGQSRLSNGPNEKGRPNEKGTEFFPVGCCGSGGRSPEGDSLFPKGPSEASLFLPDCTHGKGTEYFRRRSRAGNRGVRKRRTRKGRSSSRSAMEALEKGE